MASLSEVGRRPHQDVFATTDVNFPIAPGPDAVTAVRNSWPPPQTSAGIWNRRQRPTSSKPILRYAGSPSLLARSAAMDRPLSRVMGGASR
jgi:hypothetical protein